MKIKINEYFIRHGELCFFTTYYGKYAASYDKYLRRWLVSKFGDDVFMMTYECESCAEVKQWIREQIIEEGSSSELLGASRC